MYKLTIYVTLKKDVLDPQGKAISEAANSLGIKNILDIKQGKYCEVLLKNVSDKNNAKKIAKNLIYILKKNLEIIIIQKVKI